MPSLCYAYGCNHMSGKSKVCSFFRFPTDDVARNKWIDFCRRKDRAFNNYDRLCSCHFKNGQKEKGPTIFFCTKLKGKQRKQMAPMKLLKHDEETDQGLENDDLDIIGMKKEVAADSHQFFVPDLRVSLHQLQKDGCLCDTVLIADDDKEIKVHSVVLAASSGTFKSTLTKSDEAGRHVVRLTGLKFALLEVLVHFVYTGELVLPDEYNSADGIESVTRVLKQLDVFTASSDDRIFNGLKEGNTRLGNENVKAESTSRQRTPKRRSVLLKNLRKSNIRPETTDDTSDGGTSMNKTDHLVSDDVDGRANYGSDAQKSCSVVDAVNSSTQQESRAIIPSPLGAGQRPRYSTALMPASNVGGNQSGLSELEKGLKRVAVDVKAALLRNIERKQQGLVILNASSRDIRLSDRSLSEVRRGSANNHSVDTSSRDDDHHYARNVLPVDVSNEVEKNSSNECKSVEGNDRVSTVHSGSSTVVIFDDSDDDTEADGKLPAQKRHEPSPAGQLLVQSKQQDDVGKDSTAGVTCGIKEQPKSTTTTGDQRSAFVGQSKPFVHRAPFQQRISTNARNSMMLECRRVLLESKSGAAPRPLSVMLSRFVRDQIASIVFEPDPPKCFYCDTVCANVSSLQKHVIDEHVRFVVRDFLQILLSKQNRTSLLATDRFLCDFCGMSCKNRYQFFNHRAAHLGEQKLYNCTECGRRFLYNSQLRKHKAVEHGVGDSHRLCDICGQNYKEEYRWRDHLLSEHGKELAALFGVEAYKCSFCDATFLTKSKLQKHKLKQKHLHSRKLPTAAAAVDSGGGDGGGGESVDGKSLEKNKPKKRYFCNFCDSSYTFKNNLHFHVRQKHKGFTCHLCSRLFVAEPELTNHLNGYTDQHGRRHLPCADYVGVKSTNGSTLMQSSAIVEPAAVAAEAGSAVGAEISLMSVPDMVQLL